MSDNETNVMKYLCGAFAVFVLTAGGCTMHRNVLRYEAIKSGVDPMALSCASGVSDNEQHICTIIAQKGKGESK